MSLLAQFLRLPLCFEHQTADQISGDSELLSNFSLEAIRLLCRCYDGVDFICSQILPVPLLVLATGSLVEEGLSLELPLRSLLQIVVP